MDVLYNYGDIVKFKFDGNEAEGVIGIVDRYGTFEQNKEPSYDIMIMSWGEDKQRLFVKHVRQSGIIEKTGHSDENVFK